MLELILLFSKAIKESKLLEGVAGGFRPINNKTLKIKNSKQLLLFVFNCLLFLS